MTQLPAPKGPAGAGVQIAPPLHVPGGAAVAPHARATLAHDGGVVVAVPPVGVHVPPDAAAEATVTLTAASVVAHEVASVRVSSSTAHVLSK
jgi:hypothetical protein